MKIIITSNATFEWDDAKDAENKSKHGVGFEEAQQVFEDKLRVTYLDEKHSTSLEKRYKCIGKIDTGICTVRFTLRDGKIRIIGAGYWRKERRAYEQENQDR